jgi:hypothetical protein
VNSAKADNQIPVLLALTMELNLEFWQLNLHEHIMSYILFGGYGRTRSQCLKFQKLDLIARHMVIDSNTITRSVETKLS